MAKVGAEDARRVSGLSDGYGEQPAHPEEGREVPGRASRTDLQTEAPQY